MQAEAWRPTPELRWSTAGKLQQRFARKCWETFDLRQYGGNGWRTRGFMEHEWRDVPTESPEPQGDDRGPHG